MRLCLLLAGLCLASLSNASRLSISGSHIMRDGKRFFLSGANSAWIAYGYDFGDHQYQQRRPRYLEMMDTVSKAGGNSMRTWVHIHGASSPKWNQTGHVTGLDSGDGSFLADFKQYLDDAQARNLLIFPCLWNGAVVHDVPERIAGLMHDEGKMQSYLDNALTPWVTAVKDHPALGGWDIINEVEGFVKNTDSSEPCFQNHGLGWASPLYSPQEIEKFLNWQADAIYKADSQALVTAGSASIDIQVDVFGHHNIYKDECLIKGGGRPNGVLNFYSTHSYDWQGKFSADNIFKHSYADYQLHKPLVVAEFSADAGAGMTSPEQFNYIYDHGYSGAWSWMMLYPGGNAADTPAVQATGIASIRHNHDQSSGGNVRLRL